MKRHIAVFALAVMFFGLPGYASRPALAQSAASPEAGDIQARVPFDRRSLPRRDLGRHDRARGRACRARPGRLVPGLRSRHAAGRRERRQGPVRRERPGGPCHPGRSGARAADAQQGPSRRRRREPGRERLHFLHGPAAALRPDRSGQARSRSTWPTRTWPLPPPRPSRRSAVPKRPRSFSRRSTPRRPSAKLSIVDALGALRSREAVKKLLPLTASPDEGLRRAARVGPGQHRRPGRRRRSGERAGDRVVPGKRRGRRSLSPVRAPPRGLRTDRRGPGRGPRDPRFPRRSRREPGRLRSPELIVSILGDKALPTSFAAVDGPADAVRGAALEMAAGLGTGDRDGPMDREGDGGLGSGSPGGDHPHARPARRCDGPAVRPREPPQRRPSRPPGRRTGGGPAGRRERRRRPLRAFRLRR